MSARRRLDLLAFMPFRLNRLAAEFSQTLAADYRRFGIDIPEWRVLATLGRHAEARSAQYVVRCTRTHKSRISRAVAQLVGMELVARDGGGEGGGCEGGREIMLRLTPQGRGVYEELVPLLLKRERTVMACLTAAEAETLGTLLGKLEAAFALPRCEE